MLWIPKTSGDLASCHGELSKLRIKSIALMRERVTRRPSQMRRNCEGYDGKLDRAATGPHGQQPW